MGAVQLGGRVTLLCEPGPPGQSKDDAARCVRAVARPKGGFPSEFEISKAKARFNGDACLSGGAPAVLAEHIAP